MRFEKIYQFARNAVAPEKSWTIFPVASNRSLKEVIEHYKNLLIVDYFFRIREEEKRLAKCITWNFCISPTLLIQSNYDFEYKICPTTPLFDVLLAMASIDICNTISQNVKNHETFRYFRSLFLIVIKYETE